MQLDCLNEISADDIESFLEYLTYYQKPDPFCPEKMIDIQNDAVGKTRKLAAVRTMYQFFYKKQKINNLKKNIFYVYLCFLFYHIIGNFSTILRIFS